MHRQRGKKYLEVRQLVDKSKEYPIEAAVQLIKKISYAKFDASIELHINATKKGLLAKVQLPYGIGKEKKIAIVDENILKEIEKGKLDFDVLITHPKYMPQLVKYARLLGPKGLMPNPKNGTITSEPEKLKKELEQGTSLEIKTEPKAEVAHVIIGKKSFEDKKLIANLTAILKSLKPSEVKSIYMAPTMGPSVKLTFPI